MNNVVVMDARDWHKLCYNLMLDSYIIPCGATVSSAPGRKEAFETYFKCKVKWKSNLDTWSDNGTDDRLGPSMVLTFSNEADAITFSLKYL